MILRSRLLRLTLCCLVAGAANAAVGDGVPRISGTPGQLLAGPLVPEQGRTAIIAFHQGWLWTIPEVPSSTQVPGATLDYRVRMWDILGLDPALPDAGINVVRTLERTAHPVNAHGHLKWSDVLLIGQEYQVPTYRADPASLVDDDSVRPTHSRALFWEGRGQVTPPWQADVKWTYGDVADPTRLIFRPRDFNDADGRVEVDLRTIEQTGVMGMPIILGNLLLYASDQSKTGIASYDISDPANPVLLDVLNEGEIGGYFPEVWRHYVVWPNRRGGGSFQVVDFSDPSDLKLVANVDLPAGDPMYVQFQDEYAFMERYKIDMRTFEVVLTLDEDGTGVETSQYSLPVGNLLFTGGVGQIDGQVAQGLGVWFHQAEPDTRAPFVGYHIPRDGQTGYPLTHSLSLLVHETLETATIVNGETAIVRPVGGAPIAGDWWFSYNDILTFVPAVDLQPDTTYEVVLPEGGIKDVSGNGIQAYSFSFSTGNAIAGNSAPVIAGYVVDRSPVSPGSQATLSVAASDPDGDALSYRFDMGDGSPVGDWQSETTVAHTFTAPGRYRTTVQVRDSTGRIASASRAVTVWDPPQGPAPTASSAIILDSVARCGWCVNPDNNTVSCFDLDSFALVWEMPVGDDPRSLARAADGSIWVACHDGDTLEIIDAANGTGIRSIGTGYGSAPIGIAMDPTGNTAYVSAFGSGEIIRFDTVSRTESQRAIVVPSARSVAVSADGSQLLVGRFHSPTTGVLPAALSQADAGQDDFHGEVVVVDAASLSVQSVVRLLHDRGFYGTHMGTDPETTFAGRGTPNYVRPVVYDPRGGRAWYGAKKDNQFGGALFSRQLDDDNSVRAILGGIDLDIGADMYRYDNSGTPVHWRRDVDNADSPAAIAFTPNGDYLLLALQGINRVLVYDLLSFDGQQDSAAVTAQFTTGLAPMGLAVDGPGRRVFTKNFMDRSVSVHDLGPLMDGQGGVPAITAMPTVGSERLPPMVLRGKQIFYNAGDRRMSAEGYISCATCHLDGGHDGRIWDFTARGEGLRNTTDLRGRSGTGHGAVHWTANFDEIHDFENDIRTAFAGDGFLSDADFAATSDPLGASKAGRSADLDALAAYVSSLGPGTIPRSPHRNADGSMTASAIRGAALFTAQGCRECHSGGTLQDGLRHDVGTIGSLSGSRIGGLLDGIDTPTLHGLWATAPYLHDGSAATLDQVFELAGGTAYQVEDGSLFGGASRKDNSQWPPIDGYLGTGVLEVQSVDSGLSLSVDGGSGGTALVSIRYSDSLSRNSVDDQRRFQLSAGAASVELTSDRSLYWDGWGTHTWKWMRTELALAAGANTLTLRVSDNGRWPPAKVDAVVVATADQLARAEPHRRVSALDAADRADLLSYLGQLDYRDRYGRLMDRFIRLLISDGVGPLPTRLRARQNGLIHDQEATDHGFGGQLSTDTQLEMEAIQAIQ